jgi:Brp/Blh family beta-carotene 15,15'-monooxygenase
MEKVYNLSIFLSFLGLWITSILPEESEIFLGFILIFSFGILHGSNDILLIETISNKKTAYPFIRILTIYLITVFTAVLIFNYIPIFALGLFVIFSAFHFGEQHWENSKLKINKSVVHAYYFFYGLFILMLLFIFNIEEVITIVESISKFTLRTNHIFYSFVTTSCILLLLSIYVFYNSKKNKSIAIKELFYLGVFAIIFKVSSLIWGFTIYFIFWHSIPSLFEQVNFIYGDFNKNTIVSYLKNALPYWLISLVGLIIVLLIFKKDHLLYAILFSFIAAVTFPHALVITKMFKNKKQTL